MNETNDVTDNNVAELTEKIAVLLEEIAAAIKDESLSGHARRGGNIISSEASPKVILRGLTSTAHIVNVRLANLRKEGTLTPEKHTMAIKYGILIDEYIRDALLVLNPPLKIFREG